MLNFDEFIEKEKNPIKKIIKKIFYKIMSPVINDIYLSAETIKSHAENIQGLNKIVEGHRDNIQLLNTTVADYAKNIHSLNLQSQKFNNNLSELNEHVLNGYAEIDYRRFEDRFRGSLEIIKERQKEYLKYIGSCKNVLDIGCGRGEFLSILNEQSISARGVDLYEPYVKFCREQGLNVECMDGIEYLKQIANNSVDAIFSAQLVEHLSYAKIMELIRYSYKALEDGGYLILETPNPMSLYIFAHAFYMDPTHKKPIHPYTLQYLIEIAGFKSIEIVFTECSKPKGIKFPDFFDNLVDTKNEEQVRWLGKMKTMLFGSQDYAIVARK